MGPTITSKVPNRHVHAFVAGEISAVSPDSTPQTYQIFQFPFHPAIAGKVSCVAGLTQGYTRRHCHLVVASKVCQASGWSRWRYGFHGLTDSQWVP